MSDNPQPNVSKTINFSGGTIQGDFVAENKTTTVHGDYIENQFNQGSVPAASRELAKQLDALLQSLEQTVPNASTETGKEAVKEAAMQKIEKDTLLRDRLLAALKAGAIETVQQFCKHPIASVVLATFKAAFPDGKKS